MILSYFLTQIFKQHFFLTIITRILPFAIIKMPIAEQHAYISIYRFHTLYTAHLG